jgi:hypothetical protein
LVLKVLEQRFRHNITYREVNICYMNAQKERGSDSENFGTRIIRFGVVVEKI